MTKGEVCFGGETVPHSFPYKDLDLLGTRGYPNPLPKGFVPRDLMALKKEFRRGFDETRALIVGPKKRFSDASKTGHRNPLNKGADMGGEGKI